MSASTSEGEREISLAHHPDLALPGARPADATSWSSPASSPTCGGAAFCDEISTTSQAIGATTFVTLGALLADVPHTRPVPITGLSSDPELAEQYGLEPSRYTGPTGIVGVLQEASAQRGLATCRTGPRSRTTSRSRRRPRRPWRCSVSSRTSSGARSTCGPARGGEGLGARRRRAGLRRLRRRRVRALARGGERHRRPARGDRRRDRPRVRALPPPPRPTTAAPRRRAQVLERVDSEATDSTTAATEFVRRRAAARLRRLGPGVDAARAPGASRSSAIRASTSRTRRLGVRAAAADRVLPGLEPRLRRRQTRRRTTPSRRGSGATAGRAGSRAGRRRWCAAPRPARGCRSDFDILWPSKPTMPPCA